MKTGIKLFSIGVTLMAVMTISFKSKEQPVMPGSGDKKCNMYLKTNMLCDICKKKHQA